MKRITINLRDEDYEVLKRLKDLNGGSMSKIVSELVVTVTPVLSQMADNFETVLNADRKLKNELLLSTEKAFNELSELQEEAMRIHKVYSGELARNLGVKNEK